MRKVVVFGNGIGRALSNDSFSLPEAIRRVCDNRDLISLDHLNLMREFLQKEPAEGIGEDDLDVLHRAIFACDFLASTARGEKEILTEDGVALPGVFGRFVHNVATELSLSDHKLPAKFSDSMAAFIRDTYSHVATLNYDQLLYKALIEHKLFNGYTGHLVDGLVDAGYEHENLETRGANRFGLYLHLHGSPLVYEDDDGIYKYSTSELDYAKRDEMVGRHLVLTNVKHKTLVIEQSRLLKSYWSWFAWTLQQPDTDGLIFFGLGAQDMHLLRTIQNHLSPDKPIQIVEWRGERRDRRAFWEQKFPQFELKIYPLDNVLSFDGWWDSPG